MLRALDLFCGAGGVSYGLVQAGFDVTGVDNRPQPHYPYQPQFILQDAMQLSVRYLKKFDFIWASPPCQRYSTCTTKRRLSFPDYIPGLRALLRSSGRPYCIENVPLAPLISPIELCGRMFGLPLIRHRLFEANFEIRPPKHKPHDGKEIPVYGNGTSHWHREKTGGRNFTHEDKSAAMGIEWMPTKSLKEAIPPAYAKFIGRQLLKRRFG